MADVDAGPPSSWLCVGEHVIGDGAKWELYRAPLPDTDQAFEAGVWFKDLPPPRGKYWGLLTAADASEHVRWNSDAADVFVTTPVRLREGEGFRVELHDLYLYNTSANLEQSTVTPIWSWQGGEYWAIIKLDAAGASYYFDPMEESPYGGHLFASQAISGKDFALNLWHHLPYSGGTGSPSLLTGNCDIQASRENPEGKKKLAL